MDNITESEQNFLRRLGIKTDYKINFWLKNYRERRQYSGPLPDDVEEGRRWNDSLHKIEKDLEVVKQNTKGLPSLAKVFRDLFKKGAGDIDEHVLK